MPALIATGNAGQASTTTANSTSTGSFSTLSAPLSRDLLNSSAFPARDSIPAASTFFDGRHLAMLADETRAKTYYGIQCIHQSPRQIPKARAVRVRLP